MFRFMCVMAIIFFKKIPLLLENEKNLLNQKKVMGNLFKFCTFCNKILWLHNGNYLCQNQ